MTVGSSLSVGDEVFIYDYLDSFTPLPEEKLIVMNDRAFTYDYLDEAQDEYRGVNRIYKPSAVLFWTDFKNNKVRKGDARRLVVDEAMLARLSSVEVIG